MIRVSPCIDIASYTLSGFDGWLEKPGVGMNLISIITIFWHTAYLLPDLRCQQFVFCIPSAEMQDQIPSSLTFQYSRGLCS